MKKVLLTMIALVGLAVAFSGCVQGSRQSTQADKELIEEDAIKQAELSARVETGIFLGFKIGMSKKEYEKHYADLLKQGRITEIGSEPRCNITTKDGWEGTLTFGATTYKDSVFAMTFLILNESLDSDSHIHLISSFKETEKFKDFVRFSKRSEYNNTSIETYIKDNLVVEFGLNRMSYYDAPTMKIKKQLKEYEKEVEEAEKKQRADASVSDF